MNLRGIKYCCYHATSLAKGKILKKNQASFPQAHKERLDHLTISTSPQGKNLHKLEESAPKLNALRMILAELFEVSFFAAGPSYESP